MWSSDDEDTSMESDTEEEDDDDPDGMLEADLDKNEMIQPRDVDHVGDEFLQMYYSVNSATAQRKKRVSCHAISLQYMPGWLIKKLSELWH